jgi:hypothetical protein
MDRSHQSQFLFSRTQRVRFMRNQQACAAALEVQMVRDWKSMALVSLGFSVGIAYTVALDDKNPRTAHAGMTPSADIADTPGEVAPRMLIHISRNPDFKSCAYDGHFSDWPEDQDRKLIVDVASLEAACCPAGFSFIGWNRAQEAVCFQD